ncbi:MAG: hypothetical protein E7111_08220 [Bacteroidales bacterium]|nr:hypothetical protein [Bacteroidales bacterium]
MAGRKANMSIDDLQQVAQVLKSNGTDGELVMGFRDIAPEDINLQEPVFIIFDGLSVPFFIESFTKRGNSKALVRLTDICSMEDVEEIAGKAVYVSEESLPEMSLEEDGYAALVGWTVLTPGDYFASASATSSISSTPLRSGRNDNDVILSDSEGSPEDMSLTEVGQITDFMDIPQNPCIEVETENGAVILPLHEDLILSVDPEYQEIIMQIPAGLI